MRNRGDRDCGTRNGGAAAIYENPQSSTPKGLPGKHVKYVPTIT